MSPHAGIVMVSVRDCEDDKVRAFEAGADDYVTKPETGNVKIDFQRHLCWRGQEEVHLSRKEFDLLAFMMKHPDAVRTHVKLLRTIWGPEYGGELEYLRTYVSMLRKKIEDDPANPKYVLTKPWVGYRFHNPFNPDSRSVATDEGTVPF